MAYDPADLKLPPWLLGLLDGLIRLHAPVVPHWRIAMTRPGVMFVAALTGIWAAAFYSGNNLLYLCGAVMLALMLAAVTQAAWLLKSFPCLKDELPMLETGQVTALRQLVPARATAIHNVSMLDMSAIVDIRWRHAGVDFALAGRCEQRQVRIDGRLKPERRGLFRIPDVALATSAPLGLFVITHMRRDPFELIVLPTPMPWVSILTGMPDSSEIVAGEMVQGEGDEWRDLRAYAPGDALARVHWRKADGDVRNWVVKRFGSHAHSTNAALLRVDLRQPPVADKAAFEQLLGRVYGWMQQQEHLNATLILGQATFDFGLKTQYQQALKALAAAQSESAPPIGQGGLLLSLMDGRH